MCEERADPASEHAAILDMNRVRDEADAVMSLAMPSTIPSVIFSSIPSGERTFRSAVAGALSMFLFDE